jgi:hypothetical protein
VAGAGEEALGLGTHSAFEGQSRSRWLRLGWAIATLFVVESLLFGISVLPAALFYQWHLRWGIEPPWLRIVVLAMAALPAYLLFALSFMACSAGVMRLHGWQSPRDAEHRIVDL